MATNGDKLWQLNYTSKGKTIPCIFLSQLHRASDSSLCLDGLGVLLLISCLK